VALAKERYTEALDLLTQLVLGKWDARFCQVEVPTLMEMNRISHYLTYYGLHYQIMV
jgi:hypothetical protein